MLQCLEPSLAPETINKDNDKPPKKKCCHIQHTPVFKAEVIQKKLERIPTKEIINMNKSFNNDKTKINKWFQQKEKIN